MSTRVRATGWTLLCLIGVLVLAACDDTLPVPIRACVVRGAPWAELGQTPAAADAAVSATFDSVIRIWRDGARIGLLLYPDVRVIEDPHPGRGPSPYLAKLGDVLQDRGLGGASAESIAMIDSCNAAWTRTPAPEAPGIMVVFVREIRRSDGGDSLQKGYATPLEEAYDFARTPRLCGDPPQVTAADVRARWAIVETVDGGNPVAGAVIANVTAHEIGHALLLAHGNGLDDDLNGRWDSQCDVESESSSGPFSLMHEMYGSELITDLQRKLARAAAALVK